MKLAKEISYIRGKLFWAKVLGDPVPNYNKDGNEWVFDLALDADGVKQAKGLKKLTIKDKDDDRGQFLTFKQKELRANGEPNQPIRIMDAAGKDWDPNEKIGNGTVADVKFEIRDYGVGKYPGIYPRAIRILDHVAYKTEEFAPLSSDDKFFAKAQEAEAAYKQSDAEDEAFKRDFGGHTAPDDLDDDVPM